MWTQTWGLNFTTATNSAFVTGLYVILVPVFSTVFLKKFPETKIIAAILLAVGGLTLLTNFSGSMNIGDMVTLLTAAGFAIHILYTGIAVKKCGMEGMVLAQIACTAVLSIAAMLIAGKVPQSMPLVTLASLAFLGIFATVIALIIQTSAQKFIEPTKVALIFATEPLFAAFFAFLLLGEKMAMLQWLGGVLIIAAMLLPERKN